MNKKFLSVIKKSFFTIFIFVHSVNIAQYKYNSDQFFDEYADFLTQPKNWERADYFKLLLIGGGTYSLMHLDNSIKNFALGDRNYENTFLIETGRIWGEPITSFIIGSIFTMHGIATDNQVNKKIGFEIYQSLAYGFTTLALLKNVIGRVRPNMTDDPFEFSPFYFKLEDYWALPSGHTTLAFSMSTIFAKNTENKDLKVILYIPAFLTAISRVYQNYHWTSDVFFGACLGYFIGEYICEVHNKENILEQPDFNNLVNVRVSF
ncbi:MAG: phosphatase PAP2 family protein [Ignavibacteriales bacterium]|nr:phosphatase PAP2 family protein [Ignavibacteriales bacterium]